jgi:hypothetical protein
MMNKLYELKCNNEASQQQENQQIEDFLNLNTKINNIEDKNNDENSHFDEEMLIQLTERIQNLD